MARVKPVIAPQSRADATRASILQAARRLFVRHGFAGTSIGKIAATARVNHSLVFHHFHDKAGLWKAVKASIVAESNALRPALPDTSQPFAVFIKELMIGSISFYRDNPDIVRMISWQRVEYDNKTEIGLTKSQETEAWLSAFRHYQANGSINPLLTTEFLLTFFLAIVSNAAMDPNIFIMEKTDFSDYIEFCVARLLAAFQ